MTEAEREALKALRRCSLALTGDDVWSPLAFHVDGVHPEAERLVRDGIQDAKSSAGSSPLGIVIQGQKGAGKTHLLSWTRRQVLAEGGYFFLAGLVPGLDFWVSAVGAVIVGLNRQREDGHSQLVAFLTRLATKVGLPDEPARAVTGGTKLSLFELDSLVEAVIRLDRQVGVACQDTLRALALYASPDVRQIDVARGYFESWKEYDEGERASWGIRTPRPPQPYVLRDVTWLLALTGPIVIAVDQIDALVEGSTRTTSEVANSSVEETATVVSGVGDSLMALRELTRGTVSIVSCLPHSWAMISGAASDSFVDRFPHVRTLDQIHAPLLAKELVEKRFQVSHQEIGFTPPHPLWPVHPSAFDELIDTTPRRLLTLINQHIERCLRDNEIRELRRFGFDDQERPGDASLARPVDRAPFDARFAALRGEADVSGALDHSAEDEVMGALLSAGLDAWIREKGADSGLWIQHKPPKLSSALHARLVQTVDEEVEREHHWSFRAIGHPHASSALRRFQHAKAAAELHPGVLGRELIVLRNLKWSNGPRTQEEVAVFREAGGRDLPITDADLRTFSALRVLLASDEPGLDDWLAQRKPASATELFSAVLPATVDSVSSSDWGSEPDSVVEPDSDMPPGSETPAGSQIAPAPGPVSEPFWPINDPDHTTTSSGPVITLGASTSDGTPVSVDLESLRRHTALFAASGSGKTVLLRRMVEECALLGVSVIVLDSNNDLARLGDRCTDIPEGWVPGDVEKAAEYHEHVETLVWTPGHSARPLAFPALPDFAGVLDDEDDFRIAVDAAVDALAPRAKLTGRTDKVERKKAVLREAISMYGRRGQRSLPGLIAMLSDLPDGVSGMRNAGSLAADMAETLRAAQVNDPLLRDNYIPVDLGELLAPSPGYRARISVISLVGLGSQDQKQGFVGQLQMELFAWIKKNPAGDRPLGGLLVMDEAQNFASRNNSSSTTRSTIALASQARKFGLGMIFATQAPKGVHHEISGNATTTIIGKLTVPAQMQAAEEIVRGKGGSITGIGRMRPGRFYVCNDEFASRRTDTRMCLSHHPKSALTQDEVIQRARGGRS